MTLSRDAWRASFTASEGSCERPFPLAWRLFVPRTAPPRATVPLLVALHRYGGDPERFVRIVPWLGLSGFAFAFPQGPFRVVPEKGPIQYAWALSRPDAPDTRGREFSLESLAEMIRRLGVALPASPATTVLLGHSQGGYMALHLLVRHPDLARTAVSLGGQMNADLARADAGGDAPRRACLIHGEADDLVPIARAEEAARLLSEIGAAVTFRRIPNANHWPTRATYAEAGSWIREALGIGA